MTLRCPAHVELLMHYYCSPEPHERADSDMVKTFTAQLLIEKAIEWDEKINSYRTTARGEAWVKLICNTPIPTPAFIDQHGNVICTK